MVCFFLVGRRLVAFFVILDHKARSVLIMTRSNTIPASQSVTEAMSKLQLRSQVKYPIERIAANIMASISGLNR